MLDAATHLGLLSPNTVVAGAPRPPRPRSLRTTVAPSRCLGVALDWSALSAPLVLCGGGSACGIAPTSVMSFCAASISVCGEVIGSVTAPRPAAAAPDPTGTEGFPAHCFDRVGGRGLFSGLLGCKPPAGQRAIAARLPPAPQAAEVRALRGCLSIWQPRPPSRPRRAAWGPIRGCVVRYSELFCRCPTPPRGGLPLMS